MTSVPASPGNSPEVPAPDAPPGLAGPTALPEDTDRDGEVDVLYLAGQRLPAEGAWLLATAVDGQPGGEFTAQVLPETSASAFGGDVVVRLSPDDPAAGQPPPGARVQVHAVMSGRLIPVATWAGLDLDGWPERNTACACYKCPATINATPPEGAVPAPAITAPPRRRARSGTAMACLEPTHLPAETHGTESTAVPRPLFGAPVPGTSNAACKAPCRSRATKAWWAPEPSMYHFPPGHVDLRLHASANQRDPRQDRYVPAADAPQRQLCYRSAVVIGHVGRLDAEVAPDQFQQTLADH